MNLRPPDVDGGVMVLLNGGIGNLVIAAPILAALERERPGLRVHLPANTFLDEPWLVGALPLACARQAQYPPLWRRCAPDDVPKILDFMRQHGISTLLNFRCEYIKDDGRYLAFREQASAAGIACWDLHQLPADVQKTPIGRQMVAVLAMAGVELPAPDWTWLRALRAPVPGKVGCYVGASVGVKRWQPARWAETIDGLVSQGMPPVEVAAGPDPRERRLAAAVVSQAVGAVRAETSTLADLVTWLAGLECVVSNDTVVVHLAAALGCPTVGLYLATDGRIWSAVTEPHLFRVLQSDVALACRAMKPDGTCRRFYRGCPAPCRGGVTVDEVVSAVKGMTTSTRRTESLYA